MQFLSGYQGIVVAANRQMVLAAISSCLLLQLLYCPFPYIQRSPDREVDEEETEQKRPVPNGNILKRTAANNKRLLIVQ